MVNEYKKVVLVKGLESLSDYHFRMFKSLLAKKLKLTRTMQEECDRIKIADLMEDKFRKDSGLSEMIAFCKSIPTLQELVGILQKEKVRVSDKMKSKGKRKTPGKKSKRDGPGAAQPTSSTAAEAEPGPSRDTALSTKRKRKNKETNNSERMQLPQERSQLPEPSTSSTLKTEGCPQAPDLPPPTPCEGSSKKGKRKNKETNDSKRMQFPQERSQLPEPSTSSTLKTEGCPQAPDLPPPTPCESSSKRKRTSATPSCGIQHPPMPETPSRKKRSPQVSVTTPYQNTQVPQMLVTPSGGIQMPLMPPMPKTPSRKAQSPRVSVTPSQNTQVPQMLVTASGGFQMPLMPPMPETPSRKKQSPQVSVTTLSKNTQVPQMLVTPSGGVQMPLMPPMPKTPSRKAQSPRVSVTTPSKNTQVPQMFVTPSGGVQMPPMPPMPETPSRKAQSPQVSVTTPSKKAQVPWLPVTLSGGIQSSQASLTPPIIVTQTPRISPRVSSNTQASQIPLIPIMGIQTPQTSQATPSSHPVPTRRRPRTIPTEPSEEIGYQNGPKDVMVLKATEAFTYKLRDGERMMFHATVATETEFFRMKVFDINLRVKFTPRKVITISEYVGRNGFLEIYGPSSVSDVSDDRRLNISNTLIKNAKATPKIIDLCSKPQGKFVDGEFLVSKRNVRDECTFYEIHDNTGKMEVVVYGRLTRIDCEEGDKLQLFCFELALSVDKHQLRSGIHSHIKVIKRQ